MQPEARLLGRLGVDVKRQWHDRLQETTRQNNLPVRHPSDLSNNRLALVAERDQIDSGTWLPNNIDSMLIPNLSGPDDIEEGQITLVERMQCRHNGFGLPVDGRQCAGVVIRIDDMCVGMRSWLI